jgi:hypothetical protein
MVSNTKLIHLVSGRQSAFGGVRVMQLKYVPYCFLVAAAICLAGAVGASATHAGQAPELLRTAAR